MARKVARTQAVVKALGNHACLCISSGLVTRLRLLLLMLLLTGCLAGPIGLGPLAAPTGSELMGYRRSALSYTGELDGALHLEPGGTVGGAFQARTSATFRVARWFGAGLGFVLTGMRDAQNPALSKVQGQTVAWGGFPYLSSAFFIGPVHIRLVLFGIGGGGPSIGGGFGWVGGSIGWHGERVQLWVGATAYGSFASTGHGEYSARIVEAPIGVAWSLPVGGNTEIGMTLEGVYRHVRASFASVGSESHGSAVLLGIIVRGTSDSAK